MLKINRFRVVETMLKSVIIPVFYHDDFDIVFQMIKICYQAGLRIFEFTNRDEFADQLFSALNHRVRKEMPDMLLGVGSVIDSETSVLYMQAGARFIVSPALIPEMAKVCNRRNVLWIPGCGSVTEIVYAMELGAEIVKIFPGSQVGGPEFVKAVKGPLPWCLIMPTGGVSANTENLRNWFNSGVCCVGMGSGLFIKKWIESRNYEGIIKRLHEILLTINEIKSNKKLQI